MKGEAIQGYGGMHTELAGMMHVFHKPLADPCPLTHIARVLSSLLFCLFCIAADVRGIAADSPTGHTHSWLSCYISTTFMLHSTCRLLSRRLFS